LARALSEGADFTLVDDGPLLTDSGMRRIERLISPLGGIWAAAKRREELIALALDALHLRRRDVDYRVEQGRVTMAAPDAGAAPEPTESEETVQRLIEVKEGCRLSVRPDIRARLTVPRFFRRYLRLAGTSAPARGSDREFWGLYRLKTTLTGATSSPISCQPRMFETAAAKRAAITDRARAVAGAGESLLIAVRTMAEARALSGALTESGIKFMVLQASGNEADRQALAGLDTPGSVALALYPVSRDLGLSAPRRIALNIVVAELHEAWRHVERMCRGMAVDTCEMLLSLEDSAVQAHMGRAAMWWAIHGPDATGELAERRSRWLAAWVQRRAERAGATTREELRMRDLQLEDLLAFSGNRE
jgi:preprotein translocase subunit SecA